MGIRLRVVFSFLAGVLLACSLQAQQARKAGSLEPTVTSPASGAITNGVYRNTGFGFNYKLPFGWVDRTKEISDDSSEESDGPRKSTLLLAVFERPPEATGDTVNSAVVVAAEPTSSYPGLRNAAQYFEPLTGLTKSKGLAVVNQPYDYSVGTRQLVRGDFSKPLGNLTMHQSTLVMVEKGYLVSFTFIGGSEDEVDGLVESLTFSRKETLAPHK